MKTLKREIVIGILTALATVSAVWFFFRKMEKEKIVMQTDLYALIAPDPEAILSVNRAPLFSKTLLKDSAVYAAFASKIPEVYLSIICNTSQNIPLLLSFYSSGIVLYMPADNDRIKRMEDTVFKKLFGSFSPQIQKNGEFSFIYYPDVENRFFGYYTYRGICVASYSKKLLEKVARSHSNGSYPIPSSLRTVRESFDRNAPANLMFQSNLLNLRIVTDSLTSREWKMPDRWLGADLFVSEGNSCYFGSFPCEENDSLYLALTDTLSLRMEQLFPSLHIIQEVTKDKDKIYYTGCNKNKE